jgi:glycine cleavage system P protein (glycine dehydrogenase)
MAGLKVVAVKTRLDGTLDIEDLKSKAERYSENLAAFMVRKLISNHDCLRFSCHTKITYPSTYGVFEEGVQEVSLR